MNEAELADVLCVSERKVRDMRETYLEEGKHWNRGEHGEITYTVDGAAALAGTLGVEVGKVFGVQGSGFGGENAQDAPGMAGGVSGQGAGALKGVEGEGKRLEGERLEIGDSGEGKKGDSPTLPAMVRVTVIRTLPNARHYVGKVAGTHRVVKMKTRARMGLKIGRALMCIDHGDWVEFDRRAARMMVQTTGKG